MELIIIISLEITGIKLLPKIREFNDFFSELSGERCSQRHCGCRHATNLQGSAMSVTLTDRLLESISLLWLGTL